MVVAVFTAVVAVAALRSLLTRPVCQATAQLLIERLDPLNDPEYEGPREREQIQAILAQPPGRDPTMEATIDALLRRVTVRPIRNSRLVKVSVSSVRPELAATAANTLAQLYIGQSLDLRTKTSSEARQWLGGQIEEPRKRVEDADGKLQELKRQEGLVNIEERRTLLDQRLKELGTALNERKTERLQKEALWRQMASAPNPEELPEVMRSGVVQNLRIDAREPRAPAHSPLRPFDEGSAASRGPGATADSSKRVVRTGREHPWTCAQQSVRRESKQQEDATAQGYGHA
jgi:uncharacterized protein involved in exopolysaccharide biosynthesis